MSEMTVEQAAEALETAIEGHFRARVHNKSLEHYASKLAERDLRSAMRDARPEFDAVVAAVRSEEHQTRQALVDALRELVAAVEHKDNPYDMGVFSGDDVMKQARAALKLAGEP